MVGRKIRKAYRGRQVPHGKQSVRKLMAHGTATNSIELSGDAKSFDRVARKWNVDYAAGVEAYHAAVEQLVARAQAVRPAPIKEQMAEAAKQAGKENAARPAPAKAKEARNDR